MRVLEIVRGCYGVTELVAPHLVSSLILGHAPDRRASNVIRILGARHTVQALLSITDSDTVHNLGGTVDLIHGLTAVAFAAYDRNRRSAAAVNAAIAFVFAAGEIRIPTPVNSRGGRR